MPSSLPLPVRVRAAAALLVTVALSGLGPARAAEPAREEETPLPAEVLAALRRAELPPRSLAAWVQPLGGTRPALAWNADLPVNPASVFKLVTTTAALDQLGPAFTWSTPVSFTGPVQQGVLHGSLVIQGRGDPKLVMERVWLLLRQVRDAGVREIDGDIVLDNGAFAAPEVSPADFDGEPWHPYNVLPDALLLNYKAVTLSFTPDPAAHVARVAAEPPLARVAVPATVPLSRGPCDDWRGGLKLDPADASRWHFAGPYPAACGARSWPLAYADPSTYDSRLVEALWRELGGTLRGHVRNGAAPPDALPAFVFASPPLADVIRDVNKFSNNVMAEQVFLTLALQRAGRDAAAPATPAEARGVLARWLHERLGPEADDTVIVNGSGLARETRLRVRTLGRLLEWIEASPVAAELLSSLPVTGVDGTLRRSAAAVGRAHLKTGSMRDVLAIAGEVVDANGRRWLVAAVVNDARAAGARPVMDALLGWVDAGAQGATNAANAATAAPGNENAPACGASCRRAATPAPRTGTAPGADQKR
jgi:D-alanyl-D-alanine carboxypeptidase/D-alanyl-D-alanine-endopeptidase (penicillin-binding protein 4)